MSNEMKDWLNDRTYKDEIVDLIDDLNHYTELYDAGTPAIEDSEWDDMYFKLQRLEQLTGIYLPNSPTQKVHYELKTELQKVEHSSPMLSLGKTKDWFEFLRYFTNLDPSKSVVGMVKLDGLTCRLTYEDGQLVRTETRGNGLVGEDVTHNAIVVKSIPKKIIYHDHLIVDGEIICTYKDFEPFKEEYANPRNFAAGSIRLLDSAECAKRNLTFVAWNVVEGLANNVIDNFNYLQKNGFIITPWTSSWDWDAKEFLEDRAKEDGYPIDGLVGRFNDIDYGKSLGSTSHHANAAYAFKFADEEYTTRLLDITYDIGRTGVLTPVAIFEDVDTGDSIINRASLHNLSVMWDTLGKHPYKNQEIIIYKANMIIPQVLSGEPAPEGVDVDWIPIPKVCPICGAPTEQRTDVLSTILFCSGDECPGKLITRIDHFCGKKGLDIKGLSKATLEKLIDWGWVTRISDIYKLKEYAAEWVIKPGFGPKSVNNILNAIEESRTPKLESFISAIGIPMIGTTLSKEIVKHFKSYDEFRAAADNEYDFTVMDKIAIEKCSAIWNFDYAEADELAYYMLGWESAEPAAANKTLQGQKIVITGTLNKFKNRNELQSIIESHGGKVVSSVSNNTTMLINNNSSSTSSKNLTAQKLGIPIITEEEFCQLYLEN